MNEDTATRLAEIEKRITTWTMDYSDLDWLCSLVRDLQAIIDQHNLCHDLHGKVGAREFADGCAAEQRKLYGSAPDADAVRDLTTKLAAETEAIESVNAGLGNHPDFRGDFTQIISDIRDEGRAHFHTVTALGSKLAAEEKFKTFVHTKLDEAGVPHDPDPEGNKTHGCRISGRLNWIFERERIYRGALDWYADERNYSGYISLMDIEEGRPTGSEVFRDGGLRARSALASALPEGGSK